MKILVTGGAGFIASHIVDAYVQLGHDVLVIDNLSSGDKSNLNPKANFAQMDITDPKLHVALENFKPELINHHAAQINLRASVEDPQFDARVNILGTIHLLEAARKVGSVTKVIFASTGGAIYGDTKNLPTPETEPAWPVSPYGIAKLSAEHYLYYYHQVYSIPYTVLRYGNVYGPRQNPHGEAGVVAIFFQRMFSGEGFAINGNGEQTRDFVFVKDVVNANVKATETKKTGIYNVGTGTQTSINHLVDQMKQSANIQENIEHAPAKAGEQLKGCLSYKKIQTELGWQPETSLKEGIKQTAAYFRNQ